MKNIVVFGGGSAGWLTALWAKVNLNHHNVTLVESEQIGILGVGEGTVVDFIPLIESLGIDVGEMISETRGTLKLAIQFENWNGDGKYYYHDFNTRDDYLFPQNIPYHAFLYDIHTKDKINVDDILFVRQCCETDRSPFINDNGEIKSINDYSIHFDAHLLAKYLRKKAENLGVKRIEGTAIDFEMGDIGVTGVKLSDDFIVPCDFIFDCSGFARMILGKKLETPWIDYSKSLPVKKALPFFPPQDKESIIPYTRAIAMKYGWQWHIPLMERYGCGYVFDSDHVTIDEAKRELDEWMGYEVEVPRVIDFNPGRFEKTWVKNCIAVGLASSFVEPLEATSIWTTTRTLGRISDFTPFIFDATDQMKERYNVSVANGNDNIIAFIHMHYLTKRSDSPFWRDFRKNTVMPKKLEEMLEKSKDCLLDYSIIDKGNVDAILCFDLYSHLQVMFGLGILDPKHYKKYAEYYKIEDICQPSYNEILKRVASTRDMCYTHKDLLNEFNKHYGNDLI